jgi:hypothetical protein
MMMNLPMKRKNLKKKKKKKQQPVSALFSDKLMD